MVESSVYFKIKRSYVHITDNALKVWNDQSLSGFSESNGLGPVIMSLLARAGILGYFSYKYLVLDSSLIETRPFTLVFIGILFVIYVSQSVYMLQFSYTNNIPRESIHLVKYKKGIPVLIAPHLIVYFEKNGVRHKRLLVFPTLLGDPKDKKAGLQILKDEGLYNPGVEDEGLLDT
ncbi:MAG: hypothetical protein ACFHU9_17710 [Fluviicola sp.]